MNYLYSALTIVLLLAFAWFIFKPAIKIAIHEVLDDRERNRESPLKSYELRLKGIEGMLDYLATSIVMREDICNLDSVTELLSDFLKELIDELLAAPELHEQVSEWGSSIVISIQEDCNRTICQIERILDEWIRYTKDDERIASLFEASQGEVTSIREWIDIISRDLLLLKLHQSVRRIDRLSASRSDAC